MSTGISIVYIISWLNTFQSEIPLTYAMYIIICNISYIFQGNSSDYEKAVKAAREAWQIWADVSVLF